MAGDAASVEIAVGFDPQRRLKLDDGPRVSGGIEGTYTRQEPAVEAGKCGGEHRGQHRYSKKGQHYCCTVSHLGAGLGPDYCHDQRAYPQPDRRALQQEDAPWGYVHEGVQGARAPPAVAGDQRHPGTGQTQDRRGRQRRRQEVEERPEGGVGQCGGGPGRGPGIGCPADRVVAAAGTSDRDPGTGDHAHHKPGHAHRQGQHHGNGGTDQEACPDDVVPCG